MQTSDVEMVLAPDMRLQSAAVGKSGGNGNILPRHRDAVPNRLKELFEFLVCPFISYTRRLSEVLLPAEIDSAIEGLQVPVETEHHISRALH